MAVVILSYFVYISGDCVHWNTATGGKFTNIAWKKLDRIFVKNYSCSVRYQIAFCKFVLF